MATIETFATNTAAQKQSVEDAKVREEAILAYVDVEITLRGTPVGDRERAIDVAMVHGRQLIQARIDGYQLLLDRLARGPGR